MNILQSIAGNKTILKVALGQITAALEKSNITALVIVRNPENTSEESPGLDINGYRGRIGVLTGEDLEAYEQYLMATKDAAGIEREEGNVHGN